LADEGGSLVQNFRGQQAMTLLDPGIDAASFIAALVTYLSPTFLVLVSTAMAFEVLWQGLAWVNKLKA
jgi:hypothetical protein